MTSRRLHDGTLIVQPAKIPLGVVLDPPGRAGHAERRLGRKLGFSTLFGVFLTLSVLRGDGCLAVALCIGEP